MQQQHNDEMVVLREMVRALALAQRDKALADARQNMKLVRDIERRYGLTPANTKDGKHG